MFHSQTEYRRRMTGGVGFRGSRDGLLIVLDDTEDFELVLEKLRERLNEAPQFFYGAEVTVDVGKREMSREDLLKMRMILSSEFGLRLLGIIDDHEGERSGGVMPFTGGGALQVNGGSRRKGRKGILTGETPNVTEMIGSMNSRKDEGLRFKGKTILCSGTCHDRMKTEDYAGGTTSVMSPATESAVIDGEDQAEGFGITGRDGFACERDVGGEASEGLRLRKGAPERTQRRQLLPKVEEMRRTLLLKKTLRSGQSVRYNGNVVVFGNVNPGAEVVATGDIIVAGSLKGVAHAGACGDESAIIAAFSLAPTQLRIAGFLARPPEAEVSRRNAAPGCPEMAKVKDGLIVIEACPGSFKEEGKSVWQRL
ncbi:MAG TPA: septum site-determining protein MinC [Clostridia bacterium]|nr:septum site-determining protein MinC [Clostridia bacterium]